MRVLCDIDRYRIARAAEQQYEAIVDRIEREIQQELPKLKYVRFRIDQPSRKSSTAQEPYARAYPGLLAKPTWELTDFSEKLQSDINRIINGFPEVISEYRSKCRQDRLVRGAAGQLGYVEHWRHLIVLNQSLEFENEFNPKSSFLASILDSMRSNNFVEMTYFAILNAKSNLENHCGGTNSHLRMHLGVDIPVGDLGMRVGGERLSWNEGEAIFFDDSFGHEAWNNSELERVILLVRLVHPQFSEAERAALSRIQSEFSRTPIFSEVIACLRELSEK